MEHTAFYETAKNFANVVKQNIPAIPTDSDACLCLIIADSGDIYSGVTSVTVNEGTAEVLSADKIAAMSLVVAGEVAKQMIIISLEDNSFFEADEDALRILVNARPENGSCEMLLSPEEAAPVASLLPNGGADFLSGFDDFSSPDDTESDFGAQASQDASLGAPAEFANAFDIDESNPFYASPTGNNNPNQMGGEVKSFYGRPSDNQQQGGTNAPQYPNQPQQGGYPNQQGGYPQQNGYPQQGGYPQMSGYPQQGGYPQANPYNQGGHASMYQQQGGYPQANPYNQGGHASMYQQQGGYPQANPYNQGGQSSMYQQQGGYPQANPYGSIHGSSYMQQSAYTHTAMRPGNPQAAQSSMLLSSERSDAYKKRLSNYLDDSDVALIDHDTVDEPENTTLSKSEMLKQAKERKKVAKANFSFRKKME